MLPGHIQKIQLVILIGENVYQFYIRHTSLYISIAKPFVMVAFGQSP
jgi:hypothetical protein